MNRKPVAIVVVVLAVAVLAFAYWYDGDDQRYYTGFVEAEERVIRSEVSGRVLEVRFAEGEQVPAGAVIAVLNGRSIAARIESKREEIAALAADVRAQEEQVELVEATWGRDVSARRAELEQTEAAADLAERTFERERQLVTSGASTRQLLDDARSHRDQAASMRERARELLARAEAQERQIALSKARLESLQRKHDLAEAQLDELAIDQDKCLIRAPDVATTVQTQFLWPGELAQPGSAILALLDPRDKYVQIYLPVADLDRISVGQAAELELDSRPDARIAGQVSFIADRANFTPEKIETRGDRMNQVYRVKIEVLEGVEHLKPGTEGNVYLQPRDS